MDIHIKTHTHPTNKMSAIAHFGEYGSVVFTTRHFIIGAEVHIQLRNFDPFREYALHIHEYGDTRGGCQSLGGHWNPHNTQHGNHLRDGSNRHAGDLLNNITMDEHGCFDLTFVDGLVKAPEILGRSVVIHEGRDDLGRGGDAESKVSGNAGRRLLCAVIGVCGTPPPTHT